MFSSPAEAGRDLLRHIDPKEVEDRMYDVIHIEPSVTEELLETVDIPLKVATDKSGRHFITCDYNRDGDSYRSPFTNEYYPPIKGECLIPSERLRSMEIMANKGFTTYLRHYFDSGTLSVYCWEIDELAFGVGVFILKESKDIKFTSEAIGGSISCSDVCEVRLINEQTQRYEYTLVSSTLIDISWETKALGCVPSSPVHLNGTTADQKKIQAVVDTDLQHLVNIGKLVETTSDRFVERIRQIYVSKAEEILSYMKGNPNGVSEEAAALQARTFY